MKLYQKHVKDVRTSNKKGRSVTYCEKPIQAGEWTFLDPGHAMNTLQSGSMTQICEDCVTVMVDILKTNQ